jgi:anti-sigma-K factor RskA
MTRRDPETRRLLAADYVLGTLRGRARRRFERLRNDDAALCQDADNWERRLGPMVEALPGVEPPPRVWQAIERQIRPSPARVGLWERLGFWRGLALAASAAAVALLLVVLWPRAPELPGAPGQVAVLSDTQARPTWLVRFDAPAGAAVVEPLGRTEAGAGKDYELWLLPSNNRAPVSLGLIGAAGRQRLVLSAAVAGLLPDAAGVAVSLEPRGGSPTGQPTGPVLFQGRLAAPRQKNPAGPASGRGSGRYSPATPPRARRAGRRQGCRRPSGRTARSTGAITVGDQQ